MDDEELLLAVLNSAPVVDGAPRDQLEGTSGEQLARSWGGNGSVEEREHLRQVRQALQSSIRAGDASDSGLARLVEAVTLMPQVGATGIDWQMRAPVDHRIGARVVLAWSAAAERSPGRLRACANTACNLYLLDHSRSGTARWCSMAVCGNRSKARAHASRRRNPDPTTTVDGDA